MVSGSGPRRESASDSNNIDIGGGGSKSRASNGGIPVSKKFPAPEKDDGGRRMAFCAGLDLNEGKKRKWDD